MSPLATVIVAEAAVYLYVFVHHAGLYARRRERPEYLSLGLMAAALAVHAAGAALLVDADGLSQGNVALRLKGIGLTGTVAFGIDLYRRLVGAHRAPGHRLVLLAAPVLLAAAAAGLLSDESTLAPRPTWGLSAAPDYPEPAMSSLGAAAFAGAWLVTLYSLTLLHRHRGRDRVLGYMLAAAIANMVAGAHDACIHVLSLRSFYLLEHTAMLSVVAVSYLLLDRFGRAGRELARSAALLEHSHRELRLTQRELARREQLAAVGELAAVIAHEVRNPLAIIRNAAGGLRRTRTTTEERTTLLSIVDEEVDRLGRLVTDLLSYARPLAPSLSPVDLSGLVRRALGRVAENDALSSIVLDARVDPGVGEVVCDAGLLQDVLDNVLDNACAAMPEGGTLRVTTSGATLAGRPAVAIVVKDDGEGMDTATLAGASRPFFTTTPSGTGLGLAIVDRIVGAHGGDVVLQSAPDQGTTVTITLPLAGPAEPGGAEAEST